MPIKYQPFIQPPVGQDGAQAFQQLQRSQMLAQMLQQQAMSPVQTPDNPGRQVSKIGTMQALAPMAQALMGGLAQNQVDKQETAYNTQRAQALAAGLQAMGQKGSGPMGMTSEGAQFAFQNPDNQMVQALMKANAERRVIDTGNGQAITDNDGRIIASLTKQATPDAVMSNTTTQRGQDMTAGTTMRGQDMTAATAERGQNVTLRGQNISSADARPGQDMTAATAAAGQNVTMRGQDLEQLRFDTTQKNGKPMTEADKRNAVLYNSMLDSENTLKGLSGADTSSRIERALGAVGLPSLQSDDYKKYEAAGLRWTANNLYLKSGANAPDEEVRKAWVQYFPQPGDGPDVIAQKTAARQNELAAIHANMAPQMAGFNSHPASIQSLLDKYK